MPCNSRSVTLCALLDGERPSQTVAALTQAAVAGDANVQKQSLNASGFLRGVLVV